MLPQTADSSEVRPKARHDREGQKQRHDFRHIEPSRRHRTRRRKRSFLTVGLLTDGRRKMTAEPPPPVLKRRRGGPFGRPLHRRAARRRSLGFGLAGAAVLPAAATTPTRARRRRGAAAIADGPRGCSFGMNTHPEAGPGGDPAQAHLLGHRSGPANAVPEHF